MGLIDWLNQTLRPPPPIGRVMLERIEHAVTAVDPLMRQAGNYDRILLPAVTQAWDYCERLALAIPGPFEISRAAFASDPLMHALFGSADDIETMLATSQCVRDYLTGHAIVPPGQCCALLGMRPKITAGFGTRISGEVIQRDEPQKTLSFADHTLAEPSPDLDNAHHRLAERMFDGLIKGFVAHVDEVREERQNLQDAASIERAKVRSTGPEAHTRRLGELQERLRETADTLQPDRLIHTLAEYLATPESSLSLAPLQLRVDRFGVLVEDSNTPADALRFMELTTRDLRRWVVMVVRIEREEARTAVDRFDQRRRYIVI